MSFDQRTQQCGLAICNNIQTNVAGKFLISPTTPCLHLRTNSQGKEPKKPRQRKGSIQLKQQSVDRNGHGRAYRNRALIHDDYRVADVDNRVVHRDVRSLSDEDGVDVHVHNRKNHKIHLYVRHQDNNR